MGRGTGNEKVLNLDVAVDRLVIVGIRFLTVAQLFELFLSKSTHAALSI